MELVVVMVILIALAGILLPLFPNMLNRAHTTSSATSNSELSKAIMTYQGLYYSYPNRLDNLATGSSTLFTALPGSGSDTGSYATGTTAGNGSPLTASGNIVTASLSAGTLAALNAVGITSVAQVVEKTSGSTNWTPTFFPYSLAPSATNQTTLAATTNVATLGPQAIVNLGLTQGATYVLFGVGEYTTMSGKTMDEAPVHFDDDPNYSPNVAYGRFGVLFQVTDGTGAALNQATYAGAVSFHPLSDGGVVGTDAHIQEYYNNINLNQ